jgi:hypothetical protein
VICTAQALLKGLGLLTGKAAKVGSGDPEVLVEDAAK